VFVAETGPVTSESCATRIEVAFRITKVRDLLRLLGDDGWLLARTRGSHVQFKHPSKPGLVTVAGSGVAQRVGGPK
jgi:predicted RNA binding protein YcfA (HicA-like mRNA interferase family)